jgi:hypothetical protein
MSEATEAPGPIVFVGPNQPGGLLMHGQIFEAGVGIPPYLDSLLKARPILRNYFVPVGRYSEAVKRVPNLRYFRSEQISAVPNRRANRTGRANLTPMGVRNPR